MTHTRPLPLAFPPSSPPTHAGAAARAKEEATTLGIGSFQMSYGSLAVRQTDRFSLRRRRSRPSVAHGNLPCAGRITLSGVGTSLTCSLHLLSQEANTLATYLEGASLGESPMLSTMQALPCALSRCRC
jgi:hypothetical protein